MDCRLLTLHEESTVAWNSVRTFSTNAGPLHGAAAAKEMLLWVRRNMLAVNAYLLDSGRDLSLLSKGSYPATIADGVLYQSSEIISDCYNFDATAGSGQKKTYVYLWSRDSRFVSKETRILRSLQGEGRRT